MTMPNILARTDQYSDDNDVPVPWMYQRHFVDQWNTVANQLKFRAYVDKGSAYASRKRLGKIIKANAALLGGSQKTSIDLLTCRFYEHFILACDYLKATADNDAHGLEVLGTFYPKTMSVWVWLRPDLKAIVFLAGLQCGKQDAVSELEADKIRRQEKARAMKALKEMWSEVERKVAYLLRDPADIKMLEPVVTKHLAAIEETVEFLADGANR